MRWRDTAGTTLVVLAILVFGAPWATQWIATQTVSRFVTGEVCIDGTAVWNPMRHTWTCRDLRIEGDAGETVHAAVASIRLDAQEFLRRNLVIDSAQIEGMRIRIAQAPWAPPARDVEQNLAVEGFVPDAWVESQFGRFKSDVLSASQRRDHRRRELQQQLDSLRRHCEEIEASVAANPLRTRADFQVIREMVAGILQAVAEDRVGVREMDRALQKTVGNLQNSWRAAIEESIAQSVPKPSSIARYIAEKSVVDYWESRRPLLSYASLAASPLERREIPALGRDVALPGMRSNYALVRSASLIGRMEIDDHAPIRFRAKISNWGDPSCRTAPRSEWRFESENRSATLVSDVHVETDSGLVISWKERPESFSSSRAMWRSASETEACEISVPLESIAILDGPGTLGTNDAGREWQASWNRVIRSMRSEHAMASLQMATPIAPGIAARWRCQRAELSQDTQTLLAKASERAQRDYIDRMTADLKPRLQGMWDSMDQFREKCWSDSLQQHADAMLQIERETIALRDRWDQETNTRDRLAKKP